MTINIGAALGMAIVVPFQAPINDIKDLLAEAGALWGAERKKPPSHSLGSSWGCVGALFHDPQSDWIGQWCEEFRSRRTMPVSPVNDHGILEIPWPETLDGTPFDFDVLLCTATQGDCLTPTVRQVAAAWCSQSNGYEEYFFNNIHNRLRTADDTAIWNEILAEAPDWLWGEKYLDAIKVLQSERHERTANDSWSDSMQHYLSGLRDSLKGYHDHKETMGYAGATLTVTAFIAGSMRSGRIDLLPLEGLLVASLFLWCMAHRFVRWQLLNRRRSAFMIDGLDITMGRRAAECPYGAVSVERMKWKGNNITVFVDEWLWPLKRDLITKHRLANIVPKPVLNAWWCEQVNDHGPITHERLVTIAMGASFIIFVACRLLYYTRGIHH
jgi:hypothetical protein